jgi:flagellar hook-associated protein 3 FlgL
MPIQPGKVDPNQDSINLTGEDVFGANMSVLNHLIEIKQHLQSGTADDQTWLSDTGLANLDADHSQMLQSHTELGSRMSMYNMAQNMLDSNNTIINQNLSSNDEVDVPKAITDFKNSQNVYQAALQVGAKIMPTSLVDFLK